MALESVRSEQLAEVRSYLMELQDRICADLAAEDGEARFVEREMASPRGGLHRPRVISDGPVLERAAVHFSHTVGRELPAAATQSRPELKGQPYQALSISLIVHPRNPYAPTSHLNLRFFLAGESPTATTWWFGGGFDLTPYYGFEEDARHWHRTARTACAPFGAELYPRWKQWCDRYFFLKHRDEPRGIGGLFFDDLNHGGFERCFAIQKSIGDHYLQAYLPILARRKHLPHTERERAFQLMRRGRYVEFNLLYDRGTRFGLEAGGRVESILASMPPLVSWHYDWRPEPGSPEERLLRDFLCVRDWLDDEADSPQS